MRPFEYYGGRFVEDEAGMFNGMGPYTGGTFMRGGMGSLVADVKEFSGDVKDIFGDWKGAFGRAPKDPALVAAEANLKNAQAERLRQGKQKKDNTLTYVLVGGAVLLAAGLFLKRRR